MRIAIGLVGAFLMAIATAGCNQQPVEAAPMGAPPAVRVPMGPVPGPGKVGNLPVNPYEGNQVAMAEGRQFFVWYNCAGCHGGHGGGGMGPTLRGLDKPDAKIFSIISHGTDKGMPAWGTKLPESQIWEIVAYIKSMRTSYEPEPPSSVPEPEVK
jgi:cytochrome c oxidase cbb3-type subunit III